MSSLSRELDRYLTIRRGFGYKIDTPGRVLHRFTAFAEREGTDHITTDLFLKWRSAFGHASGQTWRRRLGTVRLFALWLHGMDPKHEVPSQGLIPSRYRRSRPYIYKDQEIREIIRSAAELRSVNGIRALTYSTLFGLIAVTGMRINEALSLDVDDVDLVTAVLTVQQGKFGKSRLLPVSDSTRARLTSYAKERDRLLGAPSKPFFVSDSGERIPVVTAGYTFAVICQSIGLRPAKKFFRRGRGPRIHDLRHTFAVRTLLNWYRTGKEPAQEMFKLTTYLGHSNPAHTYWYIEAVPELLDLASKRATASLAQEVRP